MWAKRPKIAITETNQSWQDLSVIQFASWMGIPTLASSVLLLQHNSFLGAIFTIIVGNALMWFMRLGIVAMSHSNRQSTLDISRFFLGDFGGRFISLLLLASSFAWYVAQTSVGGIALTGLISIQESPEINRFFQTSVFLGVLSTIFCLGGISLLRRLSLWAFPILIISFLFIFFSMPSWNFKAEGQSLSLTGLSIFLATNLGISSDIPTFFRHSRNWNMSIKALLIVQIGNIIFGILSLFLWKLMINGFEINRDLVLSSGSFFLRYSLIVFIFVSVICANVANVYSASVGWEIIAPSALIGKKEYLIIGFGLTILFVLLYDFFSFDFLINLTDCMLVNLCLVLLFGYIIRRKINGLLDPYMKGVYFISWLLASLLNAIQFFYQGLLSPLSASLLVILITIGIAFLGRRIIYRSFNH
jgi:purine-cytosine permease-like protein